MALVRQVSGYIFYRNCPLLIVHGEQRDGLLRLRKEAEPYSNVKLFQVRPQSAHRAQLSLCVVLFTGRQNWRFPLEPITGTACGHAWPIP